MLQELIVAHRCEIAERVRQRTVAFTAPGIESTKQEQGVPVLLTQIVDALAEAGGFGALRAESATTAIKGQRRYPWSTIAERRLYDRAGGEWLW